MKEDEVLFVSFCFIAASKSRISHVGEMIATRRGGICHSSRYNGQVLPLVPGLAAHNFGYTTSVIAVAPSIWEAFLIIHDAISHQPAPKQIQNIFTKVVMWPQLLWGLGPRS